MSKKIRIKSIRLKNYRSFGEKDQNFDFPLLEEDFDWTESFNFPDKTYKKPVAIIGYNNAWKTNLMNAIKYGLYESVREDTFEIKDFHNLQWDNPPFIELEFATSWLWDDKLKDNTFYKNTITLNIEKEKIKSVSDICNYYEWNTQYSKKRVVKQEAPIFYINFHTIKEEISTTKTSWWNLRSFLWKHIDKLVKNDDVMKWRKKQFEQDIEKATNVVLNWEKTEWTAKKETSLQSFIKIIQEKYKDNLRNFPCEVEFWLPNYEDIFLQMMFKIWLNWDEKKMIPIDHFGDWYISMFVMAVIQAIAETETDNKCLFLFEEPESFLHENHQEYFYKTVLCGLTEKWHQVIYTTHSDKMIDMFDTRWIIRLETNKSNQTIKKYNETEEPQNIEIKQYNSFIKSIEPNLNKLLFSKKVILVEWPNDLMCYKFAIKNKVLEYIANKEIEDKEKYAETYLNFENIVIIPHHWKSTAILLIQLCKWYKIDYFVISDLDLDDKSLILKLVSYTTEENMKQGNERQNESDTNKKWMITTNRKLISEAWIEKIHFNVKKLETVIWYTTAEWETKNDKNSQNIWNHINKQEFNITNEFFPEKIEIFLWLNEQEKWD